MKKFFMAVTLTILATVAFAQDDSTFNYDYNQYAQPQVRYNIDKIKHWFIGGGIIAGWYSGGGSWGINPAAGYSIDRYVDVGVMLNGVYNYQTYSNSDRQHTWNLGAAPFVRVFPIPYVFFDASFEDNYVATKYFPDGGGSYNDSWNVPSLIGSVGYYTRIYGQSFFFISIGMDFLTNVNSPYREQYYTSNGTLSSKALPIIRTGFGVNLW